MILIKLLMLTCITACSIVDEGQGEVTRSESELFQSATLTTNYASSKPLDSYTQEIVSQIVANLKSYDDNKVIAVTNFVEVDSDYSSTNYLGLALGESLLHQLHIAGFNTLDFKVMDYIRVTPQGDFVVSRDFLELKQRAQIDYVMVGTLVSNNDGGLINARIVDLKTKAVISSGKAFIPKQQFNKFANYSLANFK